MLRTRYRLFVIVFLLTGNAYGKNWPPSTDVATTRERTLLTFYYNWTLSNHPVSNDSLPFLEWKRVKEGERPVTKADFRKYYYFSFAFSNSSTTPDTVLFMPGLLQRVEMLLYDTATREFIPLNERVKLVTPYTQEHLYLHRIIIPAGSYKILYVKPAFHHYNWDFWEPGIYKYGTTNDKLLVYQYPDEMISHVISAILFGILLAIFGYTIILYFQYRQQEYLWYLAYVFFITTYFVYMTLGNLAWSFHYHELDMFMPAFAQVSAHLIYFFFAKRILNLPKNKPFFNRLINIMIGVLVIYLIYHSFISFDDKYYIRNQQGFFIIRILLVLFSLYGIVVLYRSRIPLSGYIASGVLSVIVLGLFAMFATRDVFPWVNYIGGTMTFFRLGVVVELMFFLVAITEKAKMEIINKVRAIELLQIENERKELEKSMIALEAQTAERKRISAEMHDDIGSGLTTIQFLSNALPAGGDQEKTIQKITTTSRQLMDKMNEIVWSLNQDYDTLPDTIAYIRNTVSELLENAGIRYEFIAPDQVPSYQLSGETRRNIYLVVKEATHNIIKHAQATNVRYQVTVNGRLEIDIKDNGKGLEQRAYFGNGLKNMQQRMKDSGGSFSIDASNGTLVKLVLPVGS